jgi:uncharacterized iron-regulated protein
MQARIPVLLAFLLVTVTTALAQDKPAYMLFNGEGKEVHYSKMIKTVLEADAVFFGESHNDPISHWMEMVLARDLFTEKGNKLVMGAEMFEADDQLILSEYLNGLTDDKRYEDEAKLWKNYKTDYKPVLQFSRNNKIPFIATNVPRRYASLVSYGGFDTLSYLSQEALRYMAPLPIFYDPGLKCYKDMLSMGGGHGTASMGENFPKAQALKDATMAWFIAQHWKPGTLFYHFNGSYHSQNHEGIIWHLNKYIPGLKVITIQQVSQKDINKLEDENKNLADFLIVVPEDMTTTY